MDIKNTKTEKNLQAAFAGESQARNKYTYFASVAKKEGYEQLSEIFLTTAGNEMEHAKLWFKLLGGIGTTKDNLKAAAAGEHYEWTEMYKTFAEEARAEGFEAIAKLFEGVAKIENHHEANYNALLANIESQQVFNKDQEVMWICRNCGHIHTGTSAPDICSVCSHPQSYFETLVQRF